MNTRESDIKAKVYNRQNGELIFECQHDKSNRLCIACVNKVELYFNNFFYMHTRKVVESNKKQKIKEIAK